MIALLSVWGSLFAANQLLNLWGISDTRLIIQLFVLFNIFVCPFIVFVLQAVILSLLRELGARERYRSCGTWLPCFAYMFVILLSVAIYYNPDGCFSAIHR